VVHLPTWPFAEPTELKILVNQDFHGIHLGTFVGHSIIHISTTTNFIFSQNFPPSHLEMLSCNDQLGHVQNPPNSTFVHQEFYSIHLGIFVGHSNLHISKTTNFIFSQNNPPSHYLYRGAPTNLVIYKTHET